MSRKIHMVVDCKNSPGKIYACFAHKEDANLFAEALADHYDTIECTVESKTLFYGQPPVLGVNP